MEIMNVKELSAYLRVRPGTIRAWLMKRTIPVHKLGPGKMGAVRFERGEIDRWIESRKREEASP